ncbi:MAG: OmpA family protein [Pseudomonadota bacterium]
MSTSQYKTLESEYGALQKENQQLKADLDEQKGLRAKAIEAKEMQEQTMQEMIAELQEEIDAKLIRIQMLENCLTVELVEKLLFESASAKVSREGRKLLARIAPILKNAGDQEIRIVGHTDELPPSAKTKKKYPSNWELSTARATSVIRILQWGYGIDPNRLVAEGVAHYRPLKMENDQGVRTKNRTVEILLKPVAQ